MCCFPFCQLLLFQRVRIVWVPEQHKGQTQHHQGGGGQVPPGPGQQRLSRDGPSPEQYKGQALQQQGDGGQVSVGPATYIGVIKANITVGSPSRSGAR